MVDYHMFSLLMSIRIFCAEQVTHKILETAQSPFPFLFDFGLGWAWIWDLGLSILGDISKSLLKIMVNLLINRS